MGPRNKETLLFHLQQRTHRAPCSWFLVTHPTYSGVQRALHTCRAAQMASRCPKGGEAAHVRLGQAGALSVVFKRGAAVPQLMGRGLNVVETTSFLTPFPFQVPK